MRREIPMTARPTIQVGSSGEEVTTVQTCLKVPPVDGSFGQKTERAVKQFQVDQKLRPDGIVGSKTWDALEHVYRLPPYVPPVEDDDEDEDARTVIALKELQSNVGGNAVAVKKTQEIIDRLESRKTRRSKR
jgi:peptidoglycan hydrolase-like protein with peptidoglycan-binding domain